MAIVSEGLGEEDKMCRIRIFDSMIDQAFGLETWITNTPSLGTVHHESCIMHQASCIMHHALQVGG